MIFIMGIIVHHHSEIIPNANVMSIFFLGPSEFNDCSDINVVEIELILLTDSVNHVSLDLSGSFLDFQLTCLRRGIFFNFGSRVYVTQLNYSGTSLIRTPDITNKF